MKDLKPARGRRYILDLIAEGEHRQQDFKHSISDACKIARSISAFANRDGGRLLIGVKDNGVVAGVRNDEDIYVVEQAAELYCRPAQHVEFAAFSVDAHTVVIRASIAKADARPVQAREPDGRWRAYYRVADENICAHPLMVAAWRRSADPSDSIIIDVAGDAASAVLRLVSGSSVGIAPEAIAPALGISRTRASEAIVRLAAIGSLEFKHTHAGFVVQVPETVM